MKTKILRKSILQSVTFALIFTLGMATTFAQQKYQIAGNQTLDQIDTKQGRLDDALGKTMLLMMFEGVNSNTGNTEFMDGAQVIGMVSSESDGTISPFQGYFRIEKEGDMVYLKIEGTTILSDMSVEASFSIINGTGRYENIRGAGTYKGGYMSENIVATEWAGEYWIEK